MNIRPLRESVIKASKGFKSKFLGAIIRGISANSKLITCYVFRYSHFGQISPNWSRSSFHWDNMSPDTRNRSIILRIMAVFECFCRQTFRTYWFHRLCLSCTNYFLKRSYIKWDIQIFKLFFKKVAWLTKLSFQKNFLWRSVVRIKKLIRWSITSRWIQCDFIRVSHNVL